MAHFVMNATEEARVRRAIALVAPDVNEAKAMNSIRRRLFRWQGRENASDWARAAMIVSAVQEEVAETNPIPPNLFGVTH
jgi:hypothetical protein